MIADRVADALDRIAKAAAAAGRPANSVTLLPVSKTRPVADISEAAATGLTSFAENRPQELAAKAQALPGLGWVLIGPLQRNKAGLAARYASQFQALDSLPLACALDRQLQDLGRPLEVLIEVNTSGEATKHGVAPDEAVALARGLADCQALRPVGLMTVAAQGPQPVVRGCFQALREVQSRLRDEGFDWPQLSMGMSDDFEWAIDEGSTVVRLGTAIFGPRPTAVQ